MEYRVYTTRGRMLVEAASQEIAEEIARNDGYVIAAGPPTKLDLTVVPAYGRDPKTAAETMRLWTEGKDFRIADVSSPWDGSYTSIRDHGPEVTVKIRYNKLQDFLFVKGGVRIDEEGGDDVE